MERIIAGRFQSRAAADAAAAQIARYSDSADISIFHNNPPGQHGADAGGRSDDEDLNSSDAGTTAATSAITAGLIAGAAGALGGPVLALTAAGIGAYTGSLIGALLGLGNHADPSADPSNESDRRPGGVMVSVRVAENVSEQQVISTLRQSGAAGIEEADGEWREGDWADFDPLASPHWVPSRPN